MGASGKWVKTLMGLKKTEKEEHEQGLGNGKGKKWKLWRSNSGDSGPSWKRGQRGGSDGSDSYSSAVATVVRAKDFRVVRQEWAAMRIQAAFRGFLQWRSNPNPDGANVFKNQEFDNNSWGWSWLERWMAAKPWETRLMEQSKSQSQAEASEVTMTTPPQKCYTDSPALAHKKSSEPGHVRVRKNNVSTRISARPPPVTRMSSSPSSEYRGGESSASSSIGTSATPFSGTEDGSNNSKPNYMSLTESTKAKQRVQRQSMDEAQFMRRSPQNAKSSAAFSNGDSKSNAGSDPYFSKPLSKLNPLERSK